MATFNTRNDNGLRLRMFPPILTWIIGANVLVFLLGLLAAQQPDPENSPLVLMRYFGSLWPLESGWFHAWQYFTYMFFHKDFIHIFFNMLALWMFGVELANMWGAKRFLYYYLLCGVGAGVIHSIVTFLMGTGAPTIGASGAVMGVVIGFGMMFPNRLIIVFPLPPMPAKYAALVFVGIDLALGLTHSDDGIAHFAHLGGAAVGFALLYFARRRAMKVVAQRDPGAVPRNAPAIRTPARVIDLPTEHAAGRPEPARSRGRSLPSLEFGDDQALIDAILDKANREGYNSLSASEKELLIAASKRIR